MFHNNSIMKKQMVYAHWNRRGSWFGMDADQVKFVLTALCGNEQCQWEQDLLLKYKLHLGNMQLEEKVLLPSVL